MEKTKEVIEKSLNESVLEQFSLNELEQRLETDPLAIGQMLSFSNSSNAEVYGCCLFASNTGEVD